MGILDELVANQWEEVRDGTILCLAPQHRDS